MLTPQLDSQLPTFLENFPWPNGSFSSLHWEAGSDVEGMTEESAAVNMHALNLWLTVARTLQAPLDFLMSSKESYKTDYLSMFSI